MSDLIKLGLNVNQNVIKKDLNIPLQVCLEDLIHEASESRGSIDQSKRHNQDLIVTLVTLEHYFGNNLLFNSNLIITRTKIKIGEEGNTIEFIK
jgi:hypothetical protein